MVRVVQILYISITIKHHESTSFQCHSPIAWELHTSNNNDNIMRHRSDTFGFRAIIRTTTAIAVNVAGWIAILGGCRHCADAAGRQKGLAKAQQYCQAAGSEGGERAIMFSPAKRLRKTDSPL
jgi:hypothetical protein